MGMILSLPMFLAGILILVIKSIKMIQDKIYDALKESAFLYLDDFMNISLRDEEHGYYTSNKAIGKDGDFVTAPEISQMFGEIIAVKILNLIHARNIKSLI